jgi:predicted AAA+ superfamily ATPase
VQTIDGWQTLVRSLLDRGYKVLITGSSSKLLPKEISTQLRGRTLTYLLLPFSFREFIKREEIDVHTFEGKGKIPRALREYLTWGGYPEVLYARMKKLRRKF